MLLKDRLKLARKNAGKSQGQVASEANITQSNYSQLETGKIDSSSHLPEIAKVLGVDVYWLQTGETGIPSKVQSILDNTARHVLSTEIDPATKIWLPLMDISFSCGEGEDISCHFEETKKILAFEPDFLESRNVKEKNVRLLYATGDSMEPYIYQGDIFAIDIQDTDVKDGQIYAVYFEGEALLKQIFKEAGKTLILHSLNQKYKDKVVSESNGADFKVLGRQFWRAG